MKIIPGITICFIILSTSATVRPAENEDIVTLRDPECLPIWLLVELPIAPKTTHKISPQQVYVRRCMGAYDENKACISKDQVPKMEHGCFVNTTVGTDRSEIIHVGWVSHEYCKYQNRTCPIEQARKCHEKRNTHYYDEVNCICTCVVQIAGDSTCNANYSQASVKRTDDLESKEIMVTNTSKCENTIVPVHGSDERIIPRRTNISHPDDHLGQWLSNGRCGNKSDPNGVHIQFLLPDGQPAECDPNSESFCCSDWGYCGGTGKDKNGQDHCSCNTCQNFRDLKEQDPVQKVIEKWRSDIRCGNKVDPNGITMQFRLLNGQPAECDPNSESFCCSAWGYCGGPKKDKNGQDHCSCQTCEDFRDKPKVATDANEMYEADSNRMSDVSPVSLQTQIQTSSAPISALLTDESVYLLPVMEKETTSPLTGVMANSKLLELLQSYKGHTLQEDLVGLENENNSNDSHALLGTGAVVEDSTEALETKLSTGSSIFSDKTTDNLSMISPRLREESEDAVTVPETTTSRNVLRKRGRPLWKILANSRH